MLIKKKLMSLSQKAQLEHALANSIANKDNIEDVTEAILELGEMIAAQDDAIVELAGMITEE